MLVQTVVWRKPFCLLFPQPGNCGHHTCEGNSPFDNSKENNTVQRDVAAVFQPFFRSYLFDVEPTMGPAMIKTKQFVELITFTWTLGAQCEVEWIYV